MYRLIKPVEFLGLLYYVLCDSLSLHPFLKVELTLYRASGGELDYNKCDKCDSKQGRDKEQQTFYYVGSHIMIRDSWSDSRIAGHGLRVHSRSPILLKWKRDEPFKLVEPKRINLNPLEPLMYRNR